MIYTLLMWMFVIFLICFIPSPYDLCTALVGAVFVIYYITDVGCCLCDLYVTDVRVSF